MNLNVHFEENDASFNARFQENDSVFDAHIDEDDQSFKADFGEVIETIGDVEEYDGAYEVTPKVNEQTLPTASKYLSDDVTINKIPYFEVSNNSGGDTVYIGNEV